MDGQVMRFHARYRVSGDPAAHLGIEARLNRVMREELLPAYAAALDQALGDDPTVFVVRDLRVAFHLRLGEDIPDAWLARRWAGHLASAVLDSLARGEAGQANAGVVRFADQATYVASCIGHLLDGRPPDTWFYAPLVQARGLPRPALLHGILHEHRERLPLILARLHASGHLEPLLRTLDAPGQRWLWAELRGEQFGGQAAFESLFAVAVRLGESLDLWRGSPPSDALAAYLATQPRPPDWRDPSDLALAVLALLHFLADRLAVAPPLGPAAQPPTVPDAWEARLDAALAAYDWLDTARLRAGLRAWPAAPPPSRPPAVGRPLRPATAGPTPRQRQLLEHLLAVVREGQPRLDRAAPDSAANALRWYAALVAAQPDWAGDSLTPEVIRRLLAAWASLAREGPADATQLQRRLGLGEAGWRVVVALAETVKPLASPQADALPAPVYDQPASPLVVETDCAGVALLLRALLDTRFAALADRLAYPPLQGEAGLPLQALLLALYGRWAGTAATPDGRLDTGLACLAGAGLDLPAESAMTPVPALRAAWAGASPADHARFQAEWARVLLGHRLLAPSALHLYHIPAAHGDLLVAGDASGLVWPLGHVLAASESPADILAAWRRLWVAMVGEAPDPVIGDEALADALGARPDIRVAAEVDAAQQRTHAVGRERLLAALAALDEGRLGLPALDLTMMLTASSLLRLWARWLPNFSESSVPYLLRHFIRRAGRLEVYPDYLQVELEPGPLDMVLTMAGYLTPTDRLPWLGWRSLHFHLRG